VSAKISQAKAIVRFFALWFGRRRNDIDPAGEIRRRDSAFLMNSQPARGLLPDECGDLFRIAQHQDKIPWVKYGDDIEIFRLYGDGVTGPTAALLRYRRGGEVPLHEHIGYEHIFVLAGSQQDEYRTYEAGSFAINPPGTRHKVVSKNGCIVLAIYEKPVKFIER
jgi:anti-sigma factor ChrR (cupin superfamily)